MELKKNRSLLVKYIHEEAARKIITRMKEKSFSHFCVFERREDMRENLGPGVYLFVNCFTEVMYIGCAKEIRRRVRYHNKYEDGEKIITINTRNYDNAIKLESELITAIDPKRNLLKSLYGQKGFRR